LHGQIYIHLKEEIEIYPISLKSNKLNHYIVNNYAQYIYLFLIFKFDLTLNVNYASSSDSISLIFDSYDRVDSQLSNEYKTMMLAYQDAWQCTILSPAQDR